MAFFALLLPKDLQQSIATALEPARRQLPNVHWLHPDDYHLTLRFVAGLAPANLQLLMHPLRFSEFSLELQGLRTFPPQKDRGVLWIALKTPPAALAQLQESLERQVQGLGLPPDARAFAPHITVGRYDAPDALKVETLRSGKMEQDWGSFSATEYVLMKRRSGAKDGFLLPLYEVLARFPV